MVHYSKMVAGNHFKNKAQLKGLINGVSIIILAMLLLPICLIAQNKQTVVVRPETAREREERKMNDVVETFQMLGGLFGKPSKEEIAQYLNRVRNSKYSVFVEKKLAEWKEKGEFEKTADWQKRLNDSTAIKRTEIKESAVEKYAKELGVLTTEDYYSTHYKLNHQFYDSKGQYNADKEILIVNTFWGKIPIPVPLDKAKNMQDDIRRIKDLDAVFFIQDDRLALLTVDYRGYKYENPSQAAQVVRNKKLELEQKRAMELAEQERIEKIEQEKKKELAEQEKKVFNQDEKPLESVEQMPSFPGGMQELMKFISNNLWYPTVASENNIQGRVIVRFIVKEDGTVSDIQIQKGLDASCDREAIRLFEAMPKWIPGMQNGQAVPVYFTFPILFKLQQ